jgi:hypothetical protein
MSSVTGTNMNNNNNYDSSDDDVNNDANKKKKSLTCRTKQLASYLEHPECSPKYPNPEQSKTFTTDGRISASHTQISIAKVLRHIQNELPILPWYRYQAVGFFFNRNFFVM